MAAYYVPSTPPPPHMRGRAFSNPTQYYPPTPYSVGNTLSVPYTPGVAVSRSPTYYVTPTLPGRRSRSHSRARHGPSHHRSRSHQHHSGHHGHSRRSHSVGAHRQQYNRPSVHYASRPHTNATYSRHYNSPSLGKRILNFFGLGSSHRYDGQYGRGRPRYKY